MTPEQMAHEVDQAEIGELKMRLDNALAERNKAQQEAQQHRVEAAATQYRLEGVLLALRHVFAVSKGEEARK